MITHIEEPIKVGVIFDNGGKIKPVWFIWNNRHYRIKEITYSWVNREGRALIYNFSVTAGNSLYEICYNAETLSWRLLAVDSE